MKLLDLTKLNWSTTHNGGTSYGCYYKASTIENGKKYYYKCSNYYAGQDCFGDESFYEVICSRFLSKLGFDCVKYTLVYAKVTINGRVFNTYVCKSENFFRDYSSRITLENLHRVYGGTVDDLITRLGIQNQVRCMILADFMTLQRDRHGGNIELLEKNGKYVLAPLFDNGLDLLSPYPSAFKTDISKYDVLADYPVNNYIGTRSLYQNLRYINQSFRVNKLTKEDKRSIFFGMNELLPKASIDKIWELLTYRYMFLRKRGYIIDD